MLLTGTASCVRPKFCPATLTVWVRSAPALASTVYCHTPLPVPLPPELVAAHTGMLLTFQVQALPVVTATDPLPAAELNVSPCGAMLNVQPVCVTVTVTPATVSVP